VLKLLSIIQQLNNKTMRTKILFLLPALLLSASLTFAQREETVLGTRGFGLTGAWGGSQHQITQFGAQNAYINGGFFALEFGKALSIGLSNYDLNDNILWEGKPDQQFDLRWRTLSLDYAIRAHKAIHPVVGLEGGWGRAELGGERSDRLFILQPTAGLEINVFRWFHLGIEGGYRFATNNSLSGLTDAALSGAYGQVALRFGWSWGRTRYGKSGNNNRRDDD
jgi:hypothetical protein